MKKSRALLEPFWDLKISTCIYVQYLTRAPLHYAATGDMVKCSLIIIIVLNKTKKLVSNVQKFEANCN